MAETTPTGRTDDESRRPIDRDGPVFPVRRLGPRKKKDDRPLNRGAGSVSNVIDQPLGKHEAMKRKRDYIPAFHFDWLTPGYDRCIAWLFPEARLRGDMIGQADIRTGQRVLDIGCGTATLTLQVRQSRPEVEVHGLDVDAKVLSIGRDKARQAGADITWVLATATDLPYCDGSFDRVFTSLMLHHLQRPAKRLALHEVFRVLKPGGELYLLDFARPRGFPMWLVSLAVRWAEEIHDHVLGRLPGFLTEAGFQPVEEGAAYRTITGTIVLFRAVKPAGNAE